MKTRHEDEEEKDHLQWAYWLVVAHTD